MKERVKNGSLFVLAIIGILLIAFSLYGLFSQLWAKWNDGGKDETVQTETVQEEVLSDEEMQAQPIAPTDSADVSVPEEELYQPGDNPDIDAAIREELNRILNETAFSYHNDTGRNKGYAGEHRASFTNQTDVDFGMIQLEISLYKLDNPRQYGDDATIPDEPLEVHNAYVGPLTAGETVPLSFTSDTDDYNYFLFGYGYTLEE
ncbi:hypothetical protein [Agathobaculum sp. Marseille-P7918]|uniref:hypothetical protein n=1 Tax=Agathobaculum sp. Marseille-P7918 TaxID=2479843 RepID=UPI00356B1E80